MTLRVALIAAAALLVVFAVACPDTRRMMTGPSPIDTVGSTGSDTAPPPTAPPASPPPAPSGFVPSGETATVIAVGDIGMCSERAAVDATAALVARLAGRLLLAGDLAYMQGTLQNFKDCFDPAWGRFRDRWHPVPGNHEYETPGAAGYREYFGAAATPEGRTYYALRAGDWLLLMLDSNAPANRGSAQFDFVRTALTTAAPPCALAVWHHPLFSSGPNGPNVFMRDMWDLLDEHGAEVVLSAHDHLYERFGPQNVDARPETRGLRQFVVGTGGARLYQASRGEPNSEIQLRTHGVLQMTLAPRSYRWTFYDTSGATLDSGGDECRMF